MTGILPFYVSKSNFPVSYRSYSIYLGSEFGTSILFIATIIGISYYLAKFITSKVFPDNNHLDNKCSKFNLYMTY